MSAETQQPTLAEFMGLDQAEEDSDDLDRMAASESPFVRRAAETIEAAREGRYAPQPDDRPPAYRHDAFAPGGVLR